MPANNWFRKTGRDLDGIIAKRLDAAYGVGRTHCSRKGETNKDRRLCCRWLSLRHRRARDRFPFARTLRRRRVATITSIYLWFQSIATERVKTEKFERLRKPPGFTGNAPGGPSRWSTERTGEWQPVAPKNCRRQSHMIIFRRPVSTRRTRFLRWRPTKIFANARWTGGASRRKAMALL